jgi:hypothetical protein
LTVLSAAAGGSKPGIKAGDQSRGIKAGESKHGTVAAVKAIKAGEMVIADCASAQQNRS